MNAGSLVCAAAGVALGITIAPLNADGQNRPVRSEYVGKLTTCRVAGLEEEVLCGQREVYEDRTARTGRKIALNVMVLPATTDSVLRDPLVFLAGGGVVPATRYARFLGTAMPGLRRHRDVVLVDQRGTGGSNPPHATARPSTRDEPSAGRALPRVHRGVSKVPRVSR